ncbi:hypothetical protein [Pedobacter sp. SYSU D00535]|uniref:hypothetical protein n=1 Tax=Pedobacter sp. SYSU D00535 TaxID=2810308 RepID=UPI001A96ADC4|nr:hypothetical protein [Pedobacter sp. SYSU D00535]
MKKLLLTLLVVASGILATNAQSSRTYRDERGEYHYETRERRVWIPEQRVGGILGVGSRTIPGHYEMRNEQVKVYHDDRNRHDQDYRFRQQGSEGKHPHGMPPGQRKKLNNGNSSWTDTRGGRYEQDRYLSDHYQNDYKKLNGKVEKGNNGKGKKGKN